MQPKVLLAVSLFLASVANANVSKAPNQEAVATGSVAPQESSSKPVADAVTKSISTPPLVTPTKPNTSPSPPPKDPTTTKTTPTTPKTTPTKIKTTPSTSAPVASAPPVPTAPPAPLTNCNPTVAQAVPDPVPPPCPGGCTWPPLDKPPPVAPQWLQLVDLTKVPPAPLNGLDVNNDVANTNGYSLTNDPFCTWTFTGCNRNQTDVLACPNANVWGITYDDGPQPPSPILYDYLASVNQTATMFIIGSRALEYPSTLLKAYQAGHQLAIHTWSHPYLTTQPTSTIIAEIKWTEMIIQAITGVRPRYFRSPHGDLDDRVRYIITSLGYKIIQWNHDTLDWMLSYPAMYHMNPAWVDGNFSLWSTQYKNQVPGLITLEHELSLDSVCEAQKSYAIMRGAGWTPMPIANCFSDPDYYIEGGPPQQNSSAAASSALASGASSQMSNAMLPTASLSTSGALRLTGSIIVGLVGVLVVFLAMGI